MAKRKRSSQRIQETRTLYDILPPKSSASGREFARIVNLLLFHDGRRNGKSVTLFDDRAGDYHGLDAFEKKRNIITVGYQHKFYPCPLSDKHRHDIEESLRKTRAAFEEPKIRLKKWVLVTPQDPVEPATRKTGGDVTWFKNLQDQYSFEIEHWGHTQLQTLFLETPSVALYYYPELFPDGMARRKTIHGLRAQYDKALKKEHGRIEFVGMSVYKEEAARSVPMENIYIPLSLIPNGADEDDATTSHRNPLDFLVPGARHVVLGDPGSGKTTLLKFLVLFGQSKHLQQRYGKTESGKRFRFENDERLPVLVTLRRYADALKSNDNLSLIEYVRENIAADSTITGVSTEFLEYFLESGKTILLFDGLDELPNPSFKRKIRNRIQNLSETFPGNTIVVSSRIYGYDGAFRFDDKEFVHLRLAKLCMEEIEQFVHDWYDARLEKPRERKDYLNSLLGILRNEEHDAIRELARNPLLLTIMVLVHRIDAVLPDERHVLYQKCTETLLTTWHTWKSHEIDSLHRAKVDRQNMQRMQAIAYWMHHQMGETKAGQRAIVPYDALHKRLTKHIETEKPPNPDYASEDIATAFIEFVQDRAGLLIEIGDREFSFVHLTFQEYLTAAHIRTLSELDGVSAAWGKEVENHCPDPRWREVIRLLVAGYGSNESQEFLVENILSLKHTGAMIAQLLGGLLLDGVAAAEMKKREVLGRLLIEATSSHDETNLRNTLGVPRACRGKVDADWSTLIEAARSEAKVRQSEEMCTRRRLVLIAAGMNLAATLEIAGGGPPREQAFHSLFWGEGHPTPGPQIRRDVEMVWHGLTGAAHRCAGGSIMAAVVQNSGCINVDECREGQEYYSLLSTASTSAGPWFWYTIGLLRTQGVAARRFTSRLMMYGRTERRSITTEMPRTKSMFNIKGVKVGLTVHGPWRGPEEDPESVEIAHYLSEELDLAPTAHWGEALRTAILTRIPGRIRHLDSDWWEATREGFKAGKETEAAVYAAALQLAFDGLLYACGYHAPDPKLLAERLHFTEDEIAEHTRSSSESQAAFAKLAELTSDRDEPPLRIANTIRDLAYGDEAAADKLRGMVESDDPAYREIFERCYWRPSGE